MTDSNGTHSIAVPLTMTAFGAAFTVTNAFDTLTVSSPISGNGALTKAGNGTLTLTGPNTYFGGTNLNAGTVQINSPTSLGDPSGTLTFGGGEAQLLADVAATRNYLVSGGVRCGH